MNRKHWWFIVLVLIVAIGILGCSGEEAKPVNVQQETEKTVSETVATDTDVSTVDKEPVVSSRDEGKEATETLSQKNAVASAKSYLSFTAFSEKGLIEQLEFEGFSNEDAVYAVNKLNVDWKEQAAKKAEEYLSMMAFSRNGLIEQLEYEGFTNDDAAYAVSQLNVDWKEQAVIKAQDYLDFTAFSRSGLIEQLEYEGFTREEATYAVDQIGL